MTRIMLYEARYSAVPIDLARLILGTRQPKHRPDGSGRLTETSSPAKCSMLRFSF